jgi:hypothetical protein
MPSVQVGIKSTSQSGRNISIDSMGVMPALKWTGHPYVTEELAEYLEIARQVAENFYRRYPDKLGPHLDRARS